MDKLSLHDGVPPIAAWPPSIPPVDPVELAAEANHRIFNSLTMIGAMVRLRRIQLAQHPDGLSHDEALEFLDDVQRRIETVAKLHHLLIDDAGGSTFDLARHLGTICGSLKSSLFFRPSTELTTRLEAECLLPTNMALPVSLIAVEAVTNALKHGQPANGAGRITVSCRNAAPAGVVLEVADNGMGLPGGAAAREGNSGVRLMRLLTRQIGGILQFQNPGEGLRVTLMIPTPRSP